jgi:hypothetical protein
MLAVLVCALVAAIFLSPALFTGRLLSPADLLYNYYPWRAQQPPDWQGPSNDILIDSTTQFEPWLDYSARRLWSGSLPLWNPDNMLGAPFLGNMVSSLFSPFNWPYLLWPDPALHVVRAWLKLFVAALGMYLLARQVLRVGVPAAAVAAATLTFGGYMIVWLLHPHTAIAALFPWLWWATARLMSVPSGRSVALLAFIVALTIFGGHPETTYHMLLATGPFALLSAWRAGQRPVSSESTQTRLDARRFAYLVGLWAAASALGALLASVQVLPFVDYSADSMATFRRTERPGEGYWLPVRHLWTFFSPDLFGSPARHTWWGTTIDNAYSGILPLLLAPFAVIARDRTRRNLALLTLAILALALSMVYHVPGIYHALRLLPGMNLLTNTRLLLVAQFALGMLAALGAQTLLERASSGRSIRRLLLALGSVAAAWLLAGAVLPLVLGEGYFDVPESLPSAAQVWRDGLLRGALLVLLSGGAAALAVVVIRRRAGTRWRSIALALLPLLLLADVIQAYAGFMPTVERQHYFPPTAVTRYLQVQTAAEQGAPPRVLGDPWVLMPNINLAYGLSDLRGYDAVESRLYYQGAFKTAIKPGEVDSPIIPSTALNYLNVRYLVTAPGHDPNYVPDARQEVPGGVTTGEIVGGNRPGQTFTSQADTLAQVQVLGATFGGRAKGRLVFHLRESPAATEDLATQTVDAATLPNNSYWSFTFPPIKQARWRTFYFFVESPDAQPEEATTLWYTEGDPYPGGTRTQDGKPTGGDLVFRTHSPAVEGGEPWFSLAVDGGAEGASVYENRRVLPRAWLIHDADVVPDPQARLKRLSDPAFDPARTALLAAPLPPDAALPAGTVPDPGADKARITAYLPERVEIATDSRQSALLVLSDLSFPGWEATVDGTPAHVLNVNHALRGVLVPAGAHTVRFEYRPASFAAGAAISTAALLLLLILSIRWRARRVTQPPTPDS